MDVQNYRVKVDLSQFYDDPRRLSYVFVDETGVSHILHLQNRIQKVFGINRPFYLASRDGVYLPPGEDVRIVKEDETITVCPGPENSDSITVWRDIGVKCNGKPLSSIEVSKHVETVEKKVSTPWSTPKCATPVVPPEVPVNGETKQRPQNASITVAESEGQEQSSLPSDSDTDAAQRNEKNENSDFYSIPKKKKRRRVRKRKAKSSPELPNNVTRPLQVASTFAANCPSNGRPKHLKFNWDDVEESGDVKSRGKEAGEAAAELTTLLNLKNSQFPVTFAGQKARGSGAEGSRRDFQPPKVEEKREKVEIPQAISNSEGTVRFSKINPLDFPIYSLEFQARDIVAFRTLRMGADYSPTVSGYIIAEMVSRDPHECIYSFSIISGEDQLRDPDGKFSLSSYEEAAKTAETAENGREPRVYTMKNFELIEPRLIHRYTT